MLRVVLLAGVAVLLTSGFVKAQPKTKPKPPDDPRTQPAYWIKQAIKYSRSAKGAGLDKQELQEIKGDLLSSIATVQGNAGDSKGLDDTLKKLRRIQATLEEPYLRSFMEVSMAGALAAAGRFDQAKKLADGLSDPEYRSDAYLELAWGYHHHEKKNQAAAALAKTISMVREIDDDGFYWSAIATTQISFGDVPAAIKTIDNHIFNMVYRATVSCAMVDYFSLKRRMSKPQPSG